MSNEASERTELDADLEARLRDVIDKRPTCEFTTYGQPCYRPADGILVSHPCGHGAYACEPCYAAWTIYLTRNQAADPGLTKLCRVGGTHVVKTFEWRPL